MGMAVAVPENTGHAGQSTVSSREATKVFGMRSRRALMWSREDVLQAEMPSSNGNLAGDDRTQELVAAVYQSLR
jgi:hypothetical protein